MSGYNSTEIIAVGGFNFTEIIVKGGFNSTDIIAVGGFNSTIDFTAKKKIVSEKKRKFYYLIYLFI